MHKVKPQLLKLAPFFRTQISADRDHHLFSHMLREDIALGIMPIGGRTSRHPDFNVQLEGLIEENNSARALITSLSKRDNRNLNSSYSNAIEEIVKTLTWEATSLYEISNLDNVRTLHHVASRSTFRLPLFTVQIVPKEEQEYWSKNFLLCSNKHIWRISMPNCLGGPRGYKKMISQLVKVPPGSMPDFVTLDLRESHFNNTFDFASYSNKQMLYINKITSTWNWNRRDVSDDFHCEYYRAYKRAMFKYSQALLREHVTLELNKLLARLNIRSTISINGLTSSTEILDAVDKLFIGEIKFSEIYDIIYD